MFDYYARIISKIVLVIVAPHYGIASLAKLFVRNRSRRLDAQSSKFSKARQSRKVASLYSVVHSYSCVVIV